MRLPAALALAGVFLLGGCRVVDQRRVDVLLAHIATLGSRAKVAGGRSPADDAETTAEVGSTQALARELVR